MDPRKYGFLFDADTTELNGHPFFIISPACSFLKRQRNALHLTQQNVADASKITLRQYQRLESGERSILSTSFRIALGVCAALKINPKFFNEAAYF